MQKLRSSKGYGDRMTSKKTVSAATGRARNSVPKLPPGVARGSRFLGHSRDEDGTWVEPSGVLVLFNEGGQCRASIDIRTLVAWLQTNRPDLLEDAAPATAPDRECSRCGGTGKDPEFRDCTCDCCGGTGIEN